MLRDQGKESDRNNARIYFRHGSAGSASHIKQKYHDEFRERLGICSDLIADRVGPGHVSGILLTGSFSLGEGSILFDGETPVFLSDIDLLVLVDDVDLLLKLLPEKERMSKECEELFPGAVFDGRIDVGIVTAGEAGKFPRSPGVFDMSRHSEILRGGDRVKRFFPAFEEDQIGSGEGMILLENRIASFLGAYPSMTELSRRDAGSFLYQIAKSYMDIVTAALCMARRYRSGYQKRIEYVTGSGVDEKTKSLLDDQIISKAEKYLSYKIDPTEKIAGEPGGSLREIWLDTAKDIVRSWTRFECDMRCCGPVPPEGVSVEELLAGRKRGEWDLDNIRAWRSAMKGGGIRENISTAITLGSRMTCASPLELLRESAVRLISHAVTNGPGAEFSAPGGWPSFGTEKWEEAASEVNSWWRSLVFGRERL